MKTVGLLLIFLCSFAFGGFYSYKTKAGLLQLRKMIDFMYYIKSQIEFFNTPINDIYESYDKGNDQLCDFVTNVSVAGWNYALENTPKLYLSEDIVQLLNQYGAYLGKSNKDEQISHCDYYIRLLENEYKKNENDAPQKTKISLALGVSVGLMLVIFFI